MAPRPQVASDADGDAVAVWDARGLGLPEPYSCYPRVQARTISAAGVLGPVKTLSAAGQWAIDPQIATDADGDAVAVWSRSDGSNYRLQARTISAAGALGATKTLSAAGQSAFGPQIASDADGDAVAVWSRGQLVLARPGAHDLRRRRPRGDEDPVRRRAHARTPRSQATPTATRSRSGPLRGSYFRVQARTISAAGVLGPTQTLSAAGRTPATPRSQPTPTATRSRSGNARTARTLGSRRPRGRSGGGQSAVRPSSVVLCRLGRRAMTIPSASHAYGIRNQGDATLTRSMVADNTQTGIESAGSLTVLHSLVLRNAHGGIAQNPNPLVTDAHDSTLVRESTLSGNSESAIQAGAGHLTVARSTLSGNSGCGGAISALGDPAHVTVWLSTLSGNSSRCGGGGIRNVLGNVTVSQSTLSGNSAPAGGGIYNYYGATTLRSTIIARTGGSAADCFQGGTGGVQSKGYNLADDGSCNLTSQSDQPNTDPLLRPLANYGGRMETLRW